MRGVFVFMCKCLFKWVLGAAARTASIRNRPKDDAESAERAVAIEITV